MDRRLPREDLAQSWIGRWDGAAVEARVGQQIGGGFHAVGGLEVGEVLLGFEVFGLIAVQRFAVGRVGGICGETAVAGNEACGVCQKGVEFGQGGLGDGVHLGVGCAGGRKELAISADPIEALGQGKESSGSDLRGADGGAARSEQFLQDGFRVASKRRGSSCGVLVAGGAQAVLMASMRVPVSSCGWSWDQMMSARPWGGPRVGLWTISPGKPRDRSERGESMPRPPVIGRPLPTVYWLHRVIPASAIPE